MPSCPFTLYGSAPFVFERSVKGKCFIRETDHWRQHSGRLFRPSADALKPNVGDFHLILAKKKKRKTFTCVNYCVSLNSEDNFFGSYGSDLVVVESYQQNNISERLAQEGLNAVTHPDAAFWLGLMSLDDLSTNTLEAASGSLVPQYAGTCCGFPMKKGKHLAKLTSVFKKVSGKWTNRMRGKDSASERTRQTGTNRGPSAPASPSSLSSAGQRLVLKVKLIHFFFI